MCWSNEDGETHDCDESEFARENGWSSHIMSLVHDQLAVHVNLRRHDSLNDMINRNKTRELVETG